MVVILPQRRRGFRCEAMHLLQKVVANPTVRLLSYAVLGVHFVASFVIVGYAMGTFIADHALQPQVSYNAMKVQHPVAQFNCADHGGPLNPQSSDEMIYWSDIPSDSSYVSPLASDGTERFLTMEPDFSGWNNVRMSFETAVVMAMAMGRTLVLPPKQQMRNRVKGSRSVFGHNDFFHLGAIRKENKAFKFIAMEGFLEKEGMAGRLRDVRSNEVVYPPENATYVEVPRNAIGRVFPLFKYLRSVAITPRWDPAECALGIPRSTGPEAIEELNATFHSIMDGSYGKPRPKLEEFVDNPTAVNASIGDRMREMLANRRELCEYDQRLQRSKVIHLRADLKVRTLTHFYAFLFFADWKQDLWSKRFVRDKLRIRDEISCAAARVIEAVRYRSRNNRQSNSSSPEGLYDSLHVRRGDFKRQFEGTQMSADKLYSISERRLEKGSVLFIATDEQDKGFFEIFKTSHDVLFLDDFLHLLPNTNPHLYPVIDLLVASKSRSFIGTYYSSFSGYINRLRAYHVTKNKWKGHNEGTMESWYFGRSVAGAMRTYLPVDGNMIWSREYPVGWRDIDRGIDELMQ